MLRATIDAAVACKLVSVTVALCFGTVDFWGTNFVARSRPWMLTVSEFRLFGVSNFLSIHERSVVDGCSALAEWRNRFPRTHHRSAGLLAVQPSGSFKLLL